MKPPGRFTIFCWNPGPGPGKSIPPPWYYPEGIEMPEKMENLTLGLHGRGYSEDEIKGILGLNMLRVFQAVWI